VSLRGRFAAAAAAVTLVSSGAAFYGVWLVYGKTQERQLDAALLSEAEEDAIDASTSNPRVVAGSMPLRHAELAPEHKYAAIYDRGGTPLDWTPGLTQARPGFDYIRHPAGAPFDLWWNNEHLRGVLVSIPDGESEQSAAWSTPEHPRRSFFLATSRTDLDDDNTYLARKMMAAALIAALLTGAATSLLARVLTRDHERIKSVARAVAGGDLSARIGPRSGDAELALLGRDIDEMIARLAVLVETQQRFIANASHELRSPVTTLLGELSFALHRDRDAGAYRQSLEEALDSARRLKELTEDLLALARVGAPHQERQRVRLSEVSAAAATSTRDAAETRGVRVLVAPSDAVVDGHPGDLERLVRNLLENAIRHSPAGGSVRVETRADEDNAEVQVTDEGPGVPPEARERIFEPFFRLPAERAEVMGTGLGLAIGRSIARAHGGELWLDESARGARFVARIPLATPPHIH
jgi:two-component system, OmpR family, sensor kinase